MTESWQFTFSHGLTSGQQVGRLGRALLAVCVVLVAGICSVQALSWIGKPFPGFLLNQRLALPGAGQYYWTGSQAGLNTFDFIQQVNGQHLDTFPELLDVIKDHPIGTPFDYTVVRDGSIFSRTIPSMRFSVRDFFVLFGVDFLIGVTYLTIGFVIFILKPDTEVSWVFFFACLLLSVNHLTNFDVVAVHAGWLRIFFSTFTLLPAVALHLCMIFPEPLSFLDKIPWVKYLPYLVSAGLLIPLQVFYPGQWFFTSYMGAYLFYVVAAGAFLLSPLATFFRKGSIQAQQRAKVVLWGAVLAFPIPALGQMGSFSGLTIGGQPIHANFTGIPVVVFPLAVAYAIARHNLFDADVYIKRAVGYGLMTVLVAGSYFSIQTVVRTFVLDPLFGEGAEQIYPLVFALLVVFAFNPVFSAVQDLVDRLFFRKKFDYKHTITSVSNALVSLLEEKAIVHKLIETVREHMFVDAAGVVLLNGRLHPLGLFAREGATTEVDTILVEQPVPKEDPLVSLLCREKHLVTKYDVAEDPRFLPIKDSCQQSFSTMGASLAFPLFHHHEVMGMLLVGYKKSGHFFSREDIDLLTTLANQASVALETAQLAERMRSEEKVRANLARYLSPQIVDRVLKNNVQVNLGGDRKEVTILFSDIRNFTTISESWPPEKLVQILNEYFTAMAQIIFEHQGSLDKYIGDAIVSVFGSLIPLDNPALAAVRASIAMMDRMKELNAQWEAGYGLSMEIGIGVSTGEVFLGNVGSPDRMEFTVIGDTVNVASRFSGLAHAGQVLVTRETFSKLGRAVPYKELPPARVKGKADPLEVFEITLSS